MTAGLGSSNVGGLIGLSSSSSTITGNYSIGNVTVYSSPSSVSSYVGGLVGQNNGSTIGESYSTSLVSAVGATDVGGFIGNNASGTVQYSFWDKNTSGQSAGYGANAGTITTLSGLTTAQTTSYSSVSAIFGGGGATTGLTAGGITDTINTGSTPATYTWFMFDGQTR